MERDREASLECPRPTKTRELRPLSEIPVKARPANSKGRTIRAEMLCSETQGAILAPHQAGSAQHRLNSTDGIQGAAASLQLHNFSLGAKMSLPLSSRRGSSSVLEKWRFSLAKFKWQRFL